MPTHFKIIIITPFAAVTANFLCPARSVDPFSNLFSLEIVYTMDLMMGFIFLVFIANLPVNSVHT